MRFSHFVALILFGCWGAAIGEAKEVVVLLDANVRPYVEALAGFKEVSEANIKIFTRSENGDLSDERALIGAIRARRPDQILVIGSEAMSALADEITDIPIVFSMVLSPQDKLKKVPKNMTGIAMNVSPSRQMKVLAKLLPQVKRVATVYEPDESSALIDQGKKACRAIDRELVSQQVLSSTEAVEKAELLLATNAAYWMIPDRWMKSKDVVRYLFFTAREKQKALIGLSDKYVRAGALFAFTVRNEALGRQAGELSNRMLASKGRAISPIEMARDADLSINTKVAKNMGITVPDDLLRQAKVLY